MTFSVCEKELTKAPDIESQHGLEIENCDILTLQPLSQGHCYLIAPYRRSGIFFAFVYFPDGAKGKPKQGFKQEALQYTCTYSQLS